MINSIIYRSNCWGCTGKKVFFEIVALHSCQMRIRLKHLVTTCDFNNLCSRSVGLQLAEIWKNKIIRWCFSRISAKKQKISKHLLSRILFVDCFHSIERITEGNLMRLLHTALISNAFLMKIRIKENSTLCLWRNKMEDSILIKTEDAFGKFCFWL